MSGGFEIDWKGDDLLQRIRAAEVDAIDETTQACARQAAAGRQGVSANLEAEPAAHSSGRTTGRWGLFPEPDGGEAWRELFTESGNAYRPGDNAKRRAADAEYPELTSRIAGRLG